ncbi:hypothetical protein [uncultured Schumannella sp.]|uniref:hypothetical protein n=1 Tax=uncultured Schumannella sp. TaxID=1195956 RepID=UPI0025E6695A|nr:hypothetical protein [uncultured Schumannella sp.]
MSVIEAPASSHAEQRVPRRRLDPFPGDRLVRWGTRLALAIPTLWVGWRAETGSTDELNTPNQQLIDHLAGIDWTRADIAWVGEIFPPVSTLIAAVVPGGRTGLAIVGALIAGIFLQKVLEIMVQRRVPVSTTVILLMALSVNPLFAYTATQNIAAFLGLAFFGLGIADVLRFVVWGNTQAGFRAGMLLMLATLSDLSGLLYVLTAAMAAPFLRLGRGHSPGARRANVTVVVFPTLAAVGSLLFLNWVFTGNTLGTVGTRTLAGSLERWESLPELYSTLNGWLLIAPVLSAWLVALIVRRPGSIIVATLVFVAINIAYVGGLLPTGSAGNTFIVMTLLAISLVPTARSPLTVILIDAVAVLQIVIAWLAAFNRTSVLEWMNSLGNPLLGLF